MDRLNEEINEFWKKSREELEAELSEANLDAAPTVEAIRALLRRFHHFRRMIFIFAQCRTAGSKAA
jgi:hypothetical protein